MSPSPPIMSLEPVSQSRLVPSVNPGGIYTYINEPGVDQRTTFDYMASHDSYSEWGYGYINSYINERGNEGQVPPGGNVTGTQGIETSGDSDRNNENYGNVDEAMYINEGQTH